MTAGALWQTSDGGIEGGLIIMIVTEASPELLQDLMYENLHIIKLSCFFSAVKGQDHNYSITNLI